MSSVNCSISFDIPNDNKRIFKLFEIAGAVFVIISATLLHFIYDWSGGAAWAFLFSAVNESTWEHIKIFVIPYIFWSIIELLCIRLPFKRFVSVKILTSYFLMLSIPAFFYTYTALLGKSLVFVDIICSYALVVITFLLSYKVMTKLPNITRYYALSLILLALLYIMLAFFTAAPPNIFLFKDPITGFYGLQSV